MKRESDSDFVKLRCGVELETKYRNKVEKNADVVFQLRKYDFVYEHMILDFAA